MCPSQEYERKLHPDDHPLMVQRAWPSDKECHFRVRRNPIAPPLPPRSISLPPKPEIRSREEEDTTRALSALSLEESEKRYSPVYKFPSISYCRETKNDYLYIWSGWNQIYVFGLTKKEKKSSKAAKFLWRQNLFFSTELPIIRIQRTIIFIEMCKIL